jgi:hypothetical protein
MGWETLAWCEWNEFGQKVLRHHFPNAEGFGDITKTDFTKYANRIDILTGGFPCQPYSLAGKRLGKEDDRHLWPEMLRAIREIQPTYVVGENVFGIVNWNGGLVFNEVQADLEAEGYEYNRLYFQLVPSTHRTDVIGFGLLPTATTQDFKRRGPNSRQQGLSNTENWMGMLPTPTAINGSGATASMKSTQVKEGSMHSVTLSRWANMIPTPSTRDYKGARTTEKLEEKGRTELNSLPDFFAQFGKTSQLNPPFVLEMMGFPPDWTALPFLSGETNQ